MNNLKKSTALHYACVGCHLKCVQMLVSSGAKVNEFNECLLFEDKKDNKDNNVLEVHNSTSLSDVDFIGKCCTPLMLACAYDQDGVVVRELVLNANAKVNTTDKNGFNTLHYAALQGNRSVLEIVISPIYIK